MRDDLAAARGIVYACACSLLFWGAVAVAILIDRALS